MTERKIYSSIGGRIIYSDDAHPKGWRRIDITDELAEIPRYAQRASIHATYAGRR